METRVCTLCKLEYPVEEFYVRAVTKRISKCRYCRRKEERERHQKHKEETILWKTMKSRRNIDVAKRHSKKQYYKNIEDRKQRADIYRRKYKERVAAGKKVQVAVRNGVLVRATICEICNEREVMDGHHQDYSKPLEVIWLCTSCHRLLHAHNLTPDQLREEFSKVRLAKESKLKKGAR